MQIRKKSETAAVRRNVNFVGLEKCCKMSIYLQRSVLIQRRTSDLILIILIASRDLILTDHPHPLATQLLADARE